MDDSVEVGFVVYADEETFDLYIRDNVYNQKVVDEDMNGSIMIENEEDIEAIDFVLVKATYTTDSIINITHDASHHFSADKTPWFDLASEAIYDKYKPKPREKKSAKISPKKLTNKKLLNLENSEEMQ